MDVSQPDDPLDLFDADPIEFRNLCLGHAVVRQGANATELGGEDRAGFSSDWP